MNNFFITGIDTNVGKTLVSAIFVHAFGMGYWKPIQAGNLDNTDSDFIKKMVPGAKIYPEAHRFTMPASPHIAAFNENTSIDIDMINFPDTSLPCIIEGAGGVMVPINGKHCMLDLIKKMNLKVVVVVKNYLGCINHSLLTYEVLKTHNVHIAGWVINGDENSMVDSTILERTGKPLLLRIYNEENIDTAIIQKYAERLKKNEKYL
jgi:dethiobiotin synthetase